MSEQYPGGPVSPGQQPGHQTPPPPPGAQPPPPPPGQAGQHPPYNPQGQPSYNQQAPQGQPPHGQAPYGNQPPQAQPAPYGPPAQGNQVGQPADLMTRFLARLIDFVLLGIVFAIVNSIIVGIAVSAAVSGQNVGLFTFGWPAILLALLSGIISLGYFALMESSRGQTLGKMIMKVKTFGPGGGNPSMTEAVKRNVWTALGVLGIIPIVGSFIGGLLSLAAAIYIAVTINNNTTTRQGWHDTFAGGTTVIKVG